jgi:hypothetical protein
MCISCLGGESVTKKLGGVCFCLVEKRRERHWMIYYHCVKKTQPESNMMNTISNVSFTVTPSISPNGLIRNPKDVLPKARRNPNIQPKLGDAPVFSKADKFAIDFFKTKKRLEAEDAYSESVQRQNNTAYTAPAVKSFVVRHTGIDGVASQTSSNFPPDDHDGNDRPRIPKPRNDQSSAMEDVIFQNPISGKIEMSSQTKMKELSDSATSPGRFSKEAFTETVDYPTVHIKRTHHNFNEKTATKVDAPTAYRKWTTALPYIGYDHIHGNQYNDSEVAEVIPALGPPLSAAMYEIRRRRHPPPPSPTELDPLSPMQISPTVPYSPTELDPESPRPGASSSWNPSPDEDVQYFKRDKGKGKYVPKPTVLIVDRSGGHIKKFKKVPNYKTRVIAPVRTPYIQPTTIDTVVGGEHFLKGLPRDTLIRQPPPKAERFYYDIPSKQELELEPGYRRGAHPGWHEQRFGWGELPTEAQPKRKRAEGHGTTKRQRNAK